MNPLAWSEHLPATWEAKPLRAAADYVISNVDKLSDEDELPVRLCNYRDVYSNEFITSKLDFMRATASVAEIAKFGVAVGDVMITKDSESPNDIGVPALVRETVDRLVCGYHLALLRPRKHCMNGAFLLRCIQANPVRVQIEWAANGVTRFGIAKSEIGNVKLPVPPLAQQLAIADYLDRETARLAELIAAKERVFRLLAERRQALITRAVTRGLDPDAALQDSGISWLGEIPAHWRMVRLRYLVTTIEQGWSPEAASLEPGSDEWGILKLNAVLRGRFNESAAKRLPPDTQPRADLEVHTGDVLVTRSNTPALVGDACFVDATRPKLMLCDTIYRLLVQDGLIDGRFLVSFLILPAGRVQIESDARGTSASMVKISQEHVKNWWIPVPPLHEQRSIMTSLVHRLEAIDQACSIIQRTIKLLDERRSALIAATVTGQLDPADQR